MWTICSNTDSWLGNIEIDYLKNNAFILSLYKRISDTKLNWAFIFILFQTSKYKTKQFLWKKKKQKQ